MNLLRVLLRSVCGSHPSDVPPKSKISVQIEQNGNGRRSGAFLHISFKNSSICKAFGVRQRPPQGAEFVCVPCGANNSKSGGGDTVPVRPRSPAPKVHRNFDRITVDFFNFNKLEFEEVLNNGTSKVSGLGHSILHRGQQRTILFIPKERYGYLAIHSRRRRRGGYLNH